MNLSFYVFKNIINSINKNSIMLYFYTKCLKIRHSVQNNLLCIFYIWAVSYYKMILNYNKVNKNIVDFVVI